MHGKTVRKHHTTFVLGVQHNTGILELTMSLVIQLQKSDSTNLTEREHKKKYEIKIWQHRVNTSMCVCMYVLCIYVWMYVGVFKSSRTGRLEWELQMV
jgi:hypothetical protein